MPAIQKNVSFPAAQVRRIQKLADDLGITFSKAVQMLCEGLMECPVAFGKKFNTIVEIPPKEEPEND